MTNYIIENFNFYDELNKSDSVENSSDIDDICLISREKLSLPYVTLPCGHKFNYESIIDEIYHQKVKKNRLEVSYLSNIQIKCPYCRSIHNTLLPCFESNYVKEKYGSYKIKWVNSPIAYSYKPNKCLYTMKSGKNKGNKCNKKTHGDYCSKHLKQITANVEDKQDALKTSIKNDKTKQTCCAILKSGKRKGQVCGATCCQYNGEKSKYCKRHLNMLEKESK